MKNYYSLLITITTILLLLSCIKKAAFAPGTYVNDNDTQVFLVVRDDGSFILQANFCEGLGSYYGLYKPEKDGLVCSVTDVDFIDSGWEKIKEFRFKLVSGTGLQYTGDQVACGPYPEVILTRLEKWNENSEKAKADESVKEEESAEIPAEEDDEFGYGFNIFMAAEEGNLEAVKKYIENGELADARDEFNWTPLVYAIQAEQVAVIEYLIKMGADVNEYQYAVGPGRNVSIFELAMDSGNQGIIDLITKAGVDDHIIRDYYDAILNEYLAWGKTKEAEALILEKKASLPASPTLHLLVHYNQGSAGIRELIRAYGPEEIADGSVNLLDKMIPGKISFDYGAFADFQPFPLATTFKDDENDPFRFSPDKAFDNDISTAWAEGTQGPGIGQKIAFYINQETKLISIIPGFADGDTFKQYNRIKQARLKFYIEEGNVGQIESEYVYKFTGLDYKLNFNDVPVLQEFSLRLPQLDQDGPFLMNVVGVLEISAVYPGTEYDDTCVAEINCNEPSL